MRRFPPFASLGVFALIGISGAAGAATPATQPFDLSPTTAPVEPTRYPEIRPQQRYVSQPTLQYVPVPPPPPPSAFSRGEFEFSIGGQGFTSHGDSGNDSIGFVTFNFGWYFVDNLSLRLEVGVSPGTFDDRHHHHHFENDEDDGVRAEEEMVLLRWHFLNAGGLSLFADGGVGGMHADPDFPSGGRRDNFLAAVGGGVSVRLASHIYGAAGARAAWLGDGGRHHHHWSDGVQYYGELSFVFP